MKRLLIAACFCVVSLPMMISADEQRARVLLQTAEAKATLEGDLTGALKLFREAEREAGPNRALRVQVLLRMAEAFRRHRDTAEEQRIYRRIVDEFPEQKGPVATAQKRLEPARSGAVGLSTRVLPVGAVSSDSHVSSDGRWLPLVDWDAHSLVLRDLTTGKDTQLTHDGVRGVIGQQYPGASRISPDGKTIAFSWFNSQRYEIRLLDIDPPGRAEPLTLYHNPDISYLHPFAWSPDGKQLAVGLERLDRTGQVALLSVQDGTLHPLESFSWRGEMTAMAFSPDGKWLAYDLPAEDESAQHDVFLLALDLRQKTTLAPHRRNDTVVGWSPDGTHVLFSSDRTGSKQLWAQRVVGGKVLGQPFAITPDFGAFVGISRDGAMYDVLTTHTSSLFRIVDFDFATGRATSAAADPGEEYFSTNLRSQAEWSADGRQLVLSRRTGLDPLGGLMTIVTADGRKIRDVRPQLDGYAPFVWARDGRSFFAPGQELKGGSGIVQIDSVSGAAKVLVSDESIPRPLTVFGDSPDGRALYYGRLEAPPGETFGGTALHLIERQLESGAERTIATLQSNGRPRVPDFWSPRLSPDGRHIVAFDPAANGRPSLTVISVATGDRRATDSSGSLQLWAPDSRSFFAYESPTGADPRVVRIWVDTGKSERVDWNLGFDGHSFRVHPDGRRVIYVTTNGSNRSQLRKLTGVFDLLAARR